MFTSQDRLDIWRYLCRQRDYIEQAMHRQEYLLRRAGGHLTTKDKKFFRDERKHVADLMEKVKALKVDD